MTKPVWLMDVDGVLNDWRAPLDPEWTRFTASENLGFGFNITYSPTILQRILSLHGSDAVEVKWLTTWCHGANKYLRERFGFADDLEVLGYDWYRMDGNKVTYKMLPFKWWKLCAVADFVAANPDQRIIWTDDDIADDKETAVFLEKNPQILAVSPFPFLSHDDLDNIESWITT